MQSINDDKSSSSNLQYINKTFVNIFKWYIRVRFVNGSKCIHSCFYEMILWLWGISSFIFLTKLEIILLSSEILYNGM